jgi:hypothetical protein
LSGNEELINRSDLVARSTLLELRYAKINDADIFFLIGRGYSDASDIVISILLIEQYIYTIFAPSINTVKRLLDKNINLKMFKKSDKALLHSIIEILANLSDIHNRERFDFLMTRLFMQYILE